MNDSLVIVGNGFDMAHNYRTSYSDFLQHSKCPYLMDFQRFSDTYSCKDTCSGGNWYDFENTMNRITLCWFDRLNDAERDESYSERAQIMRDIKKINSIFRNIGLCLQEYIAYATSANQDYKLESVQKSIATDSSVVSFNYSNVAERYSNSVHYIHGSVSEKTIIFGYPERDEPDVIEDIATLFSKGKLREMLNFIRFLSKKGIDVASKEGTRLLRVMDTQVQNLFGARGEYDCDPDFHSLPTLIQEYGQQYSFAAAPIDFGVDIHQVKELIIMGHSLRADEDIFSLILDEAGKLRNVKIFTYNGEGTSDLKKKTQFFRGRDIKVSTCYY